jgi:S-adenosylmethionine hydrolase
MPTIVLLTDFGSKDYFVGVMKGVISSINPLARVVDLTHEIEPQNIRQASFVLWASRKYFPEDSIFVSVVDPGVGSERKVICGSVDGQLFVAPDNGLLDYVAAEGRDIHFYAASNPKYFRGDISSTFHGRDIFAPLAAHLSRGVKLSEIGDRFNYRRITKFYSEVHKGRNEGKVVYQDRFGNVFTSFLWDEALLVDIATVKIGANLIRRFYTTYSASPTKSVVGIKGSSGLLELAVNLGSAAKVLKSSVGQKVTLTLR